MTRIAFLVAIGSVALALALVYLLGMPAVLGTLHVLLLGALVVAGVVFGTKCAARLFPAGNKTSTPDERYSRFGSHVELAPPKGEFSEATVPGLIILTAAIAAKAYALGMFDDAGLHTTLWVLTGIFAAATAVWVVFCLTLAGIVRLHGYKRPPRQYNP